MKSIFPRFGKKITLEVLALCAGAAILVLCALFISPGGAGELERVRASLDGGTNQTAFCIRGCRATVYVWRFVANPNPIEQYQQTTLHWNTVGADYCWLQGPNVGAIVHPQGAHTSTPLEVGTHTFYIKCWNVGGYDSGESQWVAVSVNVYPAGSASMSLSAAPTSITTGAQSILSWNAAGDTTRINACVLSGGRFGSGTETGSLAGALETGSLAQTTVFAFNCHDTYFGWLTPVEAVVYVTPATPPPPPPPTPCTSAPNACGMRSTGQFINGVCNAVPPPNSQCPPPKIPNDNFTAKPGVVQDNQVALITWDVTDATSCTLSSDSPDFPSREVAVSGSVSSSPITQNTVFTLTCENGDGGPTISRSVKVVLTPDFQEI